MTGIPPEIIEHYVTCDEAGRLAGRGRLERERTQELIRRYGPPPPAVVLDVGGGPGVHASWLAGTGYEVHLVDPVAGHVEQAAARPGLASASIGDARRLRRKNDSVDLVLMLGPLYHLTERADRIQAWREAGRVTRPGGVILAAAISRYASALDGLARWLFADPLFGSIVDRDLADGQHRNDTGQPEFFTTAYFHHPDEIATEIAEAGLTHEATLAIEGPGWLFPDLLDAEDGSERRRKLHEVIRAVEAEPTLIGASAHIMGIARAARPAAPASADRDR